MQSRAAPELRAGATLEADQAPCSGLRHLQEIYRICGLLKTRHSGHVQQAVLGVPVQMHGSPDGGQTTAAVRRLSREDGESYLVWSRRVRRRPRASR